MNMKKNEKGLRGFRLKAIKNLSLNQKIASIVLDNGLNYQVLEILLLILKYAQLISQALLLYPSLIRLPKCFKGENIFCDSLRKF